MADYDPKEITKLLEERCTGYASEKTTAKEIAELTGLDIDVARAFSLGGS